MAAIGLLNDAQVKPEVLRRASTREHQCIVVLGIRIREGGIQGEVVPRLLGIGLMALKVVDGGSDRVPDLLLRTDRVDDIAQHGEGLERDHDLIILGEVADQKEDLLGRYRALLSYGFRAKDSAWIPVRSRSG